VGLKKERTKWALWEYGIKKEAWESLFLPQFQPGVKLKKGFKKPLKFKKKGF